jgi:hypothetical protein
MILVTGASGELGGLILDRLDSSLDVQVAAGTRTPAGVARRIDFDEPATLVEGFADVDVLVFISAGFCRGRRRAPAARRGDRCRGREGHPPRHIHQLVGVRRSPHDRAGPPLDRGPSRRGPVRPHGPAQWVVRRAAGRVRAQLGRTRRGHRCVPCAAGYRPDVGRGPGRSGRRRCASGRRGAGRSRGRRRRPARRAHL